MVEVAAPQPAAVPQLVERLDVGLTVVRSLHKFSGWFALCKSDFAEIWGRLSCSPHSLPASLGAGGARNVNGYSVWSLW